MIYSAHLDIKDVNDWKLEKCPDFLKPMDDDNEMMKNKPKSMVKVYNFINEDGKVFEQDGREIILVVQQTRGSRQNSITSLEKPTNVIKPTKSYKYSHNEDQDISEEMDNINLKD